MVAKVERYKLALKSTSLALLLLSIVVLDALRLVAKWLKHEPKPQVQVSTVMSQGKYFVTLLPNLIGRPAPKAEKAWRIYVSFSKVQLSLVSRPLPYFI